MGARRKRSLYTLYFFYVEQTLIDMAKQLVGKNDSLAIKDIFKDVLALINYTFAMSQDRSLYQYTDSQRPWDIFHGAMATDNFRHLQGGCEAEIFPMYLVLLQHLDDLGIREETVGLIELRTLSLAENEIVIKVYEPGI